MSGRMPNCLGFGQPAGRFALRISITEYQNMDTLDAEQWQRLSRHLDELLDLDADARRAYLARLEAEQPQCAAELKTILASRARSGFESFLESAPEAVAELTEVSRFTGARLGPYAIEAEIGRGGMGTV